MPKDSIWANSSMIVDELNGFKHPTPFIQIELRDIGQKYKEFKKYLPKVNIFYAVKCNPDPAIISLLDTLNSGFEVASGAEVDVVRSTAKKPKIIYSNTVKSADDIKLAYKNGVKAFAIDSQSEVLRLQKYAPGSEVFVRLAVSNKGSTIPLLNKFGILPQDAIGLIKFADKHGLKTVGVSFHVGSQAEDLHVWDNAIKLASSVIVQAKSLGYNLDTLDLGGGFPVRYSSTVPSIRDVAEVINRSLVKYNVDDLQLWAEPGRYLVAESGVVVATVISKTTRGGVCWLYLDVGRFNCFTELFESEDLRYPVLTSKDIGINKQSKKEKMVLTGPTCDSFDTIFTDVLVNKDVREGDRIYFGSGGAYTNVYGSNFNGFKVPEVYSI